MKTPKIKKIKICCGQMESYIDNGYIELHEYDDKREVVIDTALYDENEVEIDYCPFCGKKIEIIQNTSKSLQN